MTLNCTTLTKICTIVTRVAAIAYATLAFFTFLEARDLARSNGYQYDAEAGIVYVPLLLCAPPSVENDGSSLVISSNSNCRDMDYLVSAPFVCSACSAIACIFFVLMDILARYEKGPFSMSAVAGMGLYLVVILIQSGISTGALVEQNIYWVNYMQEYLDKENFDGNAKSYANTQILLASTGFAFATAFLIFIDAIFYRCNEKRRKAIEDQRIVDFVRASQDKMENSDPETAYDINKSNTVDTIIDGIEEGNAVVGADASEKSRPAWASPYK
mmetsp:Transcript_34547/g.81453  ORF Transcript_34547/g.81453 Transcript_34547/m.81453 type:complete len:272 (+) Transcript_34547:112-927(+)|eukprot:CAMPEP_0172396730 /NCGR_PEP_ID=MMETSP1061-20121228/26697_1 /TAXON_ID=37318 /ORGANISM="Pseudo-nitzschia pungens, Strain cf. pungens" /LENGTH=271 /DNA_ID=CAMNT_0013128673 /DNA_START=59 /DNA_END=874 /DNA_ORIENTATION=+